MALSSRHRSAMVDIPLSLRYDGSHLKQSVGKNCGNFKNINACNRIHKLNRILQKILSLLIMKNAGSVTIEKILLFIQPRVPSWVKFLLDVMLNCPLFMTSRLSCNKASRRCYSNKLHR